MKPRHSLLVTLLSLTALMAAPSAAIAGTTDIYYAPNTPSGGHDFNHAPIGQSFTAVAAKVKAGIYIADQISFSGASYPNAVTQQLRTNVKLLIGEGTTGTVLDSRDLTLNRPFNGFVNVDYAAAGITLNIGSRYTLLVTDISGQAYPNGVTGWVVPSVNDYSTSASLPPGAYPDGQPILQNAVVISDAGIGDNAFSVLDQAGTGGNPPTPPPSCSGTHAVITTVTRTAIEVNGGSSLTDRVLYAPQVSTTFTGGTTSFVARERVSYTGTLQIDGCHASSMTVYPIPSPLLVSGTLPSGKVGLAYSASLSASGGIAPYSWTASGVPAGLAFSNGTLSGTPSFAGSHTMTVSTSDALGVSSNTYTISIAAIDACSKPSRTKLAGATGRVNAVSSTSITIGLQRIAIGSCTQIRYKTDAVALNVGQTVAWSGWSLFGQMTAKDINVLR